MAEKIIVSLVDTYPGTDQALIDSLVALSIRFTYLESDQRLEVEPEFGSMAVVLSIIDFLGLTAVNWEAPDTLRPVMVAELESTLNQVLAEQVSEPIKHFPSRRAQTNRIMTVLRVSGFISLLPEGEMMTVPQLLVLMQKRAQLCHLLNDCGPRTAEAIDLTLKQLFVA